MTTDDPRPSAPLPASAEEKLARDAIVTELERWYFGVPFKDWKEKTEVGEWRDILNECARLLAIERADRQRLVERHAQEAKKLNILIGDQQAQIQHLERENKRLVERVEELEKQREFHDKTGRRIGNEHYLTLDEIRLMAHSSSPHSLSARASVFIPKLMDENKRLLGLCREKNRNYKHLEGRLERAETVARKVERELEGVLGAYELDLRAIMGNTNYNVLRQRQSLLQALLSDSPTGTKEKTDG